MASGRHKKLHGKNQLRLEATLEAKRNIRIWADAGIHRSFEKERDLCLLERGLS